MILAFVAVVSVLAGAVWRHAYVQGLDQLAARGRTDLALASDRLVGQLQRYRDLSVLLADHPAIHARLEGDGGALAPLLRRVADRAGALNILVLDGQGRPLVATREGAMAVTEWPIVWRALDGALGWGHGAAEPLTPRAYYHAAPVFDAAARVIGVVMVVTDLAGIDYTWRGTSPAAYFTDDRGVVFISNRSELLFWQRLPGVAGLVPPDGKRPDFSVRRAAGHEVWQLGWGPYLPRAALHLTRALPVIGMTGEVLLDVSQARRLALSQAAAVAALCLAFGSLLFLAAERRRALAEANILLEARVAARTVALRDTNAQLLREAAEREEAQAALSRAQADLVQAGKLSALGQMSAGISHELNQPLMAIRSFADNAVKFLELGKADRAQDNLVRVSDMTRRMGRIIQNLRTFARQDSVAEETVDLRLALQHAIDVSQAHLAATGVTLYHSPPDAPLWVRGGEVRLGQVFLNLITNAVDAMSGAPVRELRVDVLQGEHVEVRFRDTGPGIDLPDKVFDPFYTTKAVGPTGGMGLGLSISYGIVQSFGGQIRGTNLAEGGAQFSVRLERSPTSVEAA